MLNRMFSTLCLYLCASSLGWGDFSLMNGTDAAPIFISESEAPQVMRAVGDFVNDLARVTGMEPRLKTGQAFTNASDSSGGIIVIGQIGQGGFVDAMIAKGMLNVDSVRGKWEGYLIQEVDTGESGFGKVLAIAGSDMRGTIFGIYEVSRRIGVSPWHWWADVPVVQNPAVAIRATTAIVGSPSVKYRGIFINDEDWGLQPWAAKTFDPELGDIGPKTYEKVFELLLRLKANTLWPAMHEVTRAFNADGQNAKLADAYGIVMGSSHAEPMLRNNVREWSLPKADYNFATHPQDVLNYWDQRVAENKGYENLYTLGMRGIHDSGMTAGGSIAEKVEFLDHIIRQQREILQRHIGGDVREIPQVFTPYKEVLELYQNGLEVPDEVTLVWPDDNHGYIRHFATPEEQLRTGGSGIYYHLSYLGAPLSYLWLETTPPGVIWQQMHQAWVYGAKHLWIVNVGDIKPAEIGMEFFLTLAWDIERWQPEFLDGYLHYWSTQQFGAEYAGRIAQVLKGYYELNFQRRPEQLQWWLPHGKERSSDLNEQEVLERLAAFASLTRRVKDLAAVLPEAFQDAFFELILYPVAASDAMNQRAFYAERYRESFFQDTKLREQYGLKARQADAELRELTRYYNHELAGGKWKNLMAVEPADSHWRSYRTAEVLIPAENMVAHTLDPDLFPQTDIGDLLLDVAPTKKVKRFEELNGVVVMEAEHPTRCLSPGSASWRVIMGAGRSGDAVAIYPETSESLMPGDASASCLEYEFALKSSGDLQLTTWLLPTFPIDETHGLRFAVALDDHEPVLIEIERKVKDADWTQAVLNASIDTCRALGEVEAGEHVLRLYQRDPGVVIDKLALHFEALPKSYLGPGETLVR